MKYILRAIHGKSDVKIVSDSLHHNKNVLIMGPRGNGKTSLAAEAANDLGRKLTTVPCHTGATAETLIGQWVPNPTGTGYIWMDGLITLAVRHGHVLFLDEVNSLRAEVSFAIHGLLDHRRELILTDKPGNDGGPEVIKAHKNFGLIAAGNPDYEGTRPLNEAFKDRFSVHLTFGYVDRVDHAVLAEDSMYNSLDDGQKFAVNSFVSKVREAVKNKAIYTDVSTRAFLDFVSNIVIHGFKPAAVFFLNRIDDERSKGAVRTVMDQTWDVNGKPLNFTPAPAKTGRAGKFAANVSDQTKEASF